jgi:hypothetical protein
MGLLIVVLLIWAAVAGVLWRVLEIALGVTLGLFGFGILMSAFVYFMVRRRFRQMQRGRGGPPRRY